VDIVVEGGQALRGLPGVHHQHIPPPLLKGN
jgi:hypothetical protein